MAEAESEGEEEMSHRKKGRIHQCTPQKTERVTLRFPASHYGCRGRFCAYDLQGVCVRCGNRRDPLGTYR